MPATYSTSPRFSREEGGASASAVTVTVDVSCPRMEGSVLPMDSQRGRKSKLGRRNNSRQRKGSIPLLAAAGLDLFREGLMLDSVHPKGHVRCHPTVSPTLNSIPEDDGSISAPIRTDSQVILVLGDTLDGSGEASPLAVSRIAKGAELYWDITRVPTGGEIEQEGVVQTETIRNALVYAGISPHHIIMDCSATSVIDNVIQLIPTLRHLHIQCVHVVTSGFQIPRVKCIVDSVLGAVPDMTFEVAYHASANVLSAGDRAIRREIEQRLMQKMQQPLEDVLRAMKKQRRSSIASTRSVDSSSSRLSQVGLPSY
ncbi:hypothetical protein BBJ28_00007927 [Nothophytophthora sp. Chile5]|nr:hypothetical protein BBJ28_00007927 [Nothophytophthora sp. Chile5]